jgi:predicted acyl esterase
LCKQKDREGRVAEKSEIRDGMQIDWDVPITMEDGVVLRADIFRPVGAGKYPVILTYGPYGKGLDFKEGYKTAYEILERDYPDSLQNTSGKYLNWEVVDPEKWVPDGYVCIRIDSRGAGRSPGFMDVHGPAETKDLYQCIEWAGVQPWSNGKVGMNGISYYGANQWRVAALEPPHLAAICIWEGFSDNYRDNNRHGGILCVFRKNWQDMQVKTVQHGLGERGRKSAVTGEWVSGPESLSDAEMVANRSDLWGDLLRNDLDGEYYKSRAGDMDKIVVPLLSCANWGGAGLHLRGNIEGFVNAASKKKWLEVHGGAHWAEFYTDYGVGIQKKFLGHFLKGEDTGWDKQPKVTMQLRRPGEIKFPSRAENEWPLARTEWTKFYLDPAEKTLKREPNGKTAAIDYQTTSLDGVSFLTAPFEADTEITGPSALKLFLSSKTRDADVFLVLQVFDPKGEEVVFYGALDPHTPVGQGWLRASHRKLDPKKTKPYRPYHTHDEVQPLKPGEPVELDIEIWPTCIVVPKGYRLGINIRGRDYEWAGAATTLSNMKNPMKGCGPFVHDDLDDRPPAVFETTNTLHFDKDKQPYLLLPIIPEK